MNENPMTNICLMLASFVFCIQLDQLARSLYLIVSYDIGKELLSLPLCVGKQYVHPVHNCNQAFFFASLLIRSNRLD
ncbi:hypothetical protein DERP_000410 [Dermatophagoides pteronyssinus]|uniref:Secreted protein n=1 Tax=Dermatophagoides pteronyssinus TaxID=6956 RepID=A0ABQ8J0F5_DERPT|nr:hypothetical protein DERP_000410 [Dermatophagoides pteronyssinus]